ncbi:unnamed protein product [Dibothriocephalus latus]|uniref:Uncharacterized protein n=1 Tax=Dibothriocephalus latus TaxID=60516 RepID=A0A3P7LKE5_DIBLA|nr:unnamed protein product [Dibothriocephalus latus]
MLQTPQLRPEAAPKLTTAVPDASCYPPTDLLTLLNWLTLNQSLMAPALAQPLPPTTVFQFPLPPLLHTTSSAVTLSTPSSQKQQQSPHYFPAFNAPPPT